MLLRSANHAPGTISAFQSLLGELCKLCGVRTRLYPALASARHSLACHALHNPHEFPVEPADLTVSKDSLGALSTSHSSKGLFLMLSALSSEADFQNGSLRIQ